MRKKIIISGILAASISVAATFGGCSLVSLNANADMEQVIATVDISKAANFSSEQGLSEFKDAVGETKVVKRELISSFLNSGYSYVQSGMSYKNVFTNLADSLVNNAVLTQYATMYLLKEKSETNTKALEEYNALDSEAAKCEYLLGKDSTDVKISKYSLMHAVNSAIDSFEKNILKEDSEEAGTETRSTPGGVDSEQEDFYPKKTDENGNWLDADNKITTDESKVAIDYNVYTGYEGYLLADSGIYRDDAIEKTTRATRIRAYNNFISNLVSYNLVDASEENLRDVMSLNYINNEYVAQLENRIVEKYYDIYEEEQEEKLKAGNYQYIQSVYEDVLDVQKDTYNDKEAFSSALSNMSDTSFMLYAPQTDSDEGTYGFVYNILLPFSAAQSAELKSLQKRYADSKLDGGYKPEYFVARKNLMSGITTTDQRAAWFNGEKEYAYEATGNYFYNGKSVTDGQNNWLFFENNVKRSERYKNLEKYDGRYAYNGTAVKTEDKGYVLVANSLNIDQMLTEFEAYVNYVLNSNNAAKRANASESKYNNFSAEKLYKSDSEEIDYSNFIYAKGKVTFTDGSGEAFNRKNVLNKQSQRYAALSAVNELQYAYTTDTGVLSQYIGYSVDAGETSYIKEFEYAAHEAIKEGAGTYYVCAGDYGWHLIYVTYTFDTKTLAGGAYNGAQYTPDWASNIAVEGSFENLFYEWIKSNDISDISTTRKTQIITKFNIDSTVKRYQDRYQDLLDLNSD